MTNLVLGRVGESDPQTLSLCMNAWIYTEKIMETFLEKICILPKLIRRCWEKIVILRKMWGKNLDFFPKFSHDFSQCRGVIVCMEICFRCAVWIWIHCQIHWEKSWDNFVFSPKFSHFFSSKWANNSPILRDENGENSGKYKIFLIFSHDFSQYMFYALIITSCNLWMCMFWRAHVNGWVIKGIIRIVALSIFHSSQAWVYMYDLYFVYQEDIHYVNHILYDQF